MLQSWAHRPARQEASLNAAASAPGKSPLLKRQSLSKDWMVRGGLCNCRDGIPAIKKQEQVYFAKYHGVVVLQFMFVEFFTASGTCLAFKFYFIKKSPAVGIVTVPEHRQIW